MAGLTKEEVKDDERHLERSMKSLHGRKEQLEHRCLKVLKTRVDVPYTFALVSTKILDADNSAGKKSDR
jgi:hypothetical protein